MTLAYAAPEQVLALPITVAADVYALGVMLFELLDRGAAVSGERPRALEAEIVRGDVRRLAMSLPTRHAPRRSRAISMRSC